MSSDDDKPASADPNHGSHLAGYILSTRVHDMHIKTICEGRSGYIAACVCLDCVPGEPVILEAPAPIAPAPDELSNPDLNRCYGMKCACKGVEPRC